MESRQVKCCFLLHGLPRSLRWTRDSIVRNVFAPFGKVIHASGTVAHFNAPAIVHNPRSLEHNIPFAHPDLTGLGIDMYWIERQSDDAIAAKFEILQTHDLQAEPTLQSHRNLLHAYHSLKRAWTMAITAGFGDSDLFVFLRPDLEYIDPWPAAELVDRIVSGDSDLITPDWHQFEGINDRMAVTNRKGAEAYVSRWDMVETLAGEQTPRNSEKLLLRTAELSGLKLSTFPSRALRVRADGRTQKEDFQLSIARRLLLKARPRLKSLVTI